MVLFVFGLGIYWWHWRCNRRVGQMAIGAAIVYGLVVLLPWLLLTANQFSHDYGSYFGSIQQAAQGSNGSGSRLTAIAGVLGQQFRYQNLLLALLPTGFLFAFDASAVAVILPLAGLFVSNEFTNDFWFHHYVTSVPFFLYGTSKVLRRPLLRQHAGFITGLLIVWALLLGYLYAASSLNMMHWLYQPSIFLTTDGHARAQAAFIRAVPPGVPLDSDSSLAAHLANRETLYQIQVPSQPSLVPYTLLDLHMDMVNPPSWLVQNNRLTYTYIMRTPGFRVARADPAHGLYLFANCAHFPTAMGCASR
jgi:hypothetical protein